uniref:DUF2442 domain-containing protein n=1 Tax=Candidatus Kentrum sp. LPFa TaxID=2126335 RepID=A0A450X493_9GAMM|nr:MAG: Protein of unknown function (DUF2442) [Candidatus Kentron sp. LPFa]VFK24095.1 MAG: Protein of unknown function (DUF2442) [Candidatus Kentron sp. LPFa]
MLAINHAEYVGDYRIRLSFNDGREGIANLEKTLFHEEEMVDALRLSTLRPRIGAVVS